MWTVNFQMFKLVLEKAEEPEIKLPTSAGSSKKQESSRKISAAATAVASVVSDSVRPHRQQPTRLLCPWDSLGKNTGVGCHFLLQEKHLLLLYWLRQSLCVDHHKLWKILKEMGILQHFTCLLRNLYAGQEATVRSRYGTTNWCHIGKGVHQGCILSPCLFNLYAEGIMRNVRLDEAQAGIKIAGRNINNLRYADDTTLWQKAKRN